jgi:uncharacterized Tic20 family protein
MDMNMSESIPPFQSATPAAAPSSTRGWEVMCHLSSVIGMFGYLGMIPFGNIVAPLIVWLLKRNDSLGVDAHGKESLNFHISWTLYWIVSLFVAGALCFVLIGLLLLPVVFVAGAVGWVTMLILTIIAAVKASNGQLYRYPLTIRFLK